MVFHCFCLVSMVLQGSFMVFGRFQWFFKVVSCKWQGSQGNRDHGYLFLKINILQKSTHPKMHPPELNSNLTIPC